MDPWRTHRWLSPGGRKLNLHGRWLTQHRCVACRRDYIEYADSGERFAVHVGAVDFDQLAAEVTARWVIEPCPGSPLDTDDEDRKTRSDAKFREPRGDPSSDSSQRP